jgi:hypothetical protein
LRRDLAAFFEKQELKEYKELKGTPVPSNP